jgi:plasmid stability protein
MPKNHLTTRTAKISLEKEGYIKISILPDTIIDTEDALDNLLVIKNLSEGKKMLKLVDARGNWSMTSEAKKVSKKNVSPENTIARAYVIDSFLTKVMFNFLRSFNKPNTPEDFFNDEKEAIDWLLSFKK